MQKGCGFMFFWKRKKDDKSKDILDIKNENQCYAKVMDELTKLPVEGEVKRGMYQIKQEQISIAVQLMSVQETVVQVLFTIHHPYLADDFQEAVTGSGDSTKKAIQNCIQHFYNDILLSLLRAVKEEMMDAKVKIVTTEPHIFKITKSKCVCIGKKEGKDEGFWSLLEQLLIKRLGHKKMYWVKVYGSSDQKQAHAQVFINGYECKELSNVVLKAVMDWDLLTDAHIEKQYFFFVQENRTYQPSDFSKEQIQHFTKKALSLFEKCNSKEQYMKIREQLLTWTQDYSLSYEIFAFIPELYCAYAYPFVRIQDQLFMITEEEEMKTWYQNQVQSFYYIEEVVKEHFENDKVDPTSFDHVLQFSANANMIRKAKRQGKKENQLCLPGIGYFVNKYYQLR